MKETFAFSNNLRYNPKRQFKKSTKLHGRQWKKYKKEMQRNGWLEEAVKLFSISNSR